MCKIQYAESDFLMNKLYAEDQHKIMKGHCCIHITPIRTRSGPSWRNVCHESCLKGTDVNPFHISGARW